jgi:thiazole synthase
MLGGAAVNSHYIEIGGVTLQSRLFLGTGKFSDASTMVESVRASGASLVTVALRRFHAGREDDDLVAPLTAIDGIELMPNTSGARTADEAVRAALLARELCGCRFIKVEIHPNPHHLMPDPLETYEASRRLVKEGFIVMPYMPADPVLAKRLEDVGCAAVMPLGAAIGSGGGLQTRGMLEWIISESCIPVVVDAGLRSPSDVVLALELGVDAVLVNSAVAAATNPVGMATAFATAVTCGVDARQAGVMSASHAAIATSPLLGFLGGAEGAQDV